MELFTDSVPQLTGCVDDAGKPVVSNESNFGGGNNNLYETHAIVGRLGFSIVCESSSYYAESVEHNTKLQNIVRENLREACQRINVVAASLGWVRGLTVRLSSEGHAIETTTPNDPADRC